MVSGTRVSKPLHGPPRRPSRRGVRVAPHLPGPIVFAAGRPRQAMFAARRRRDVAPNLRHTLSRSAKGGADAAKAPCAPDCGFCQPTRAPLPCGSSATASAALARRRSSRSRPGGSTAAVRSIEPVGAVSAAMPSIGNDSEQPAGRPASNRSAPARRAAGSSTPAPQSRRARLFPPRARLTSTGRLFPRQCLVRSTASTSTPPTGRNLA